MLDLLLSVTENSSIPSPAVATIDRDQGQIMSPGYPSQYGSYLDYTWIVNATAGKVWQTNPWSSHVTEMTLRINIIRLHIKFQA